jgi:thiamine-phosphate pyrophosphorylase
MEDQRTRLMLFTPPIDDCAAFAEPLRASVARGDVAAVALTLADADERSLVNAVKALAPLIQARGGAALVVDRLQIVARGGADGVHLTGAAELAAAREACKDQDRIVGVAGLRLRDDAMAAAEKGVAYVMFGEPRADGSFPPLAAVVERARWWADIFEIPCVAFAPSLEAIPDLAATGAEFIALDEAVWKHGEGPAAAVDLALRLITRGLLV